MRIPLHTGQLMKDVRGFRRCPSWGCEVSCGPFSYGQRPCHRWKMRQQPL